MQAHLQAACSYLYKNPTMPKVSVIIPLYNASSYIPDLKQLWEQTLQDFELILVDDCSTDDTWDKLQEFKAQNSDKAIILARNEHNLGPGGTRNHGLTKSSGEYVIFLDGDDRYDPTLLEKMSQRLDDTHADLVCCGFTDQYNGVNNTHKFSQHAINTINKYNQNGGGYNDDLNLYILSKILFQQVLFPYPWNKMALRSFLSSHHISFPEILCGEDRCWVVQMILKARQIALLNDPLYHHIIGPNSISAEKSVRALEALFAQLEFEYQTLNSSGLVTKLFLSWQRHFWNYIFFFHHKVAKYPSLQEQVLSRSADFCQTHAMPTDPNLLPIGSRIPCHKLIPKLFGLTRTRDQLKELYLLGSDLRRFQALSQPSK